MLSVAYIKGKYYLCPNTKGKDYSYRTWHNISKLKYNKHGFKGIKLQRGQVIKFGRYVFKINEISTEDKSAHEKPFDPIEIGLGVDWLLTQRSNKNDHVRTSEDHSIEPALLKPDNSPRRKHRKSALLRPVSEENYKDVVWRICLSEDLEDHEDPLISPCKCAGTMKYIHLKCLKEWLESKKTTKDGVHFRSFLWEHIIWELWKEEFKSYVYDKGRRIDLLGYDVPTNNHYVVLEAINTEEIMKKKTKIIHIVDFK